uniref:Uncharacterized protein n=1 Tax=Yersinia enterocolitica W22703 TaxID=913028 RepID=F4N5I6_YEREN|nr:unknown protein [Yersinia enterocolitica W22703]
MIQGYPIGRTYFLSHYLPHDPTVAEQTRLIIQNDKLSGYYRVSLSV